MPFHHARDALSAADAAGTADVSRAACHTDSGRSRSEGCSGRRASPCGKPARLPQHYRDVGIRVAWCSRPIDDRAQDLVRAMIANVD